MQHQTTPGPGRPAASGSYPTRNTLRALESLAQAPRSAPELAQAIGMEHRSARRLLQRLAAEGYATQAGGHRRRYHPTLRLLALGAQLQHAATLPAAARPVLDALAERHAATAHLWVTAGESLTSLHHDPSPQTPKALAAPTTVLRQDRLHIPSSTQHLGPDGSCAAAIRRHGAVIAALGLTGDLTPNALTDLTLAAEQLSAKLEQPEVLT